MARIGLVLHGAEPEALEEAKRISTVLGEQGHEAVSVVEEVTDGSGITQVAPEDFAEGCLLYTSPSPRDRG